MSSISDTAMAETTTSTLNSCWNGRCSIAPTSSPLARASTSIRSRMVTISWSRSCGDSSRSPARAITNTTRPTAPQMWYSCVQNRASGTTTGRVLLATTVTIRLPSTGPAVQKPMAVARPTWGEKSRISAGVATSAMPSITPTTKLSKVKAHLLVAAGRTYAVKIPVRSSPKTTTVVRPSRSASPANSDPKAPSRLPKASATTKNVKLMCRLTSSSVDTDPPTYSSYYSVTVASTVMARYRTRGPVA